MLFDTTINPFLHQSRLALLYRTANLVMKTKKKLRNRCRYLHYFLHFGFHFLLHLYSLEKNGKGIFNSYSYYAN
jgi:hypothetical protein